MVIFKLLIKEFRLKKGMTQDELAKKARISQSYLAKLESDFRKPSPTLKVIRNLAKALDICHYQLYIPDGECGKCEAGCIYCNKKFW